MANYGTLLLLAQYKHILFRLWPSNFWKQKLCVTLPPVFHVHPTCLGKYWLDDIVKITRNVETKNELTNEIIKKKRE